jgi:hypothetical protein
VADQLNDRVTALAQAIALLERDTVDRDQMLDLRRRLNTLVINLKGLDEFVRQRIDADNALDAVLARLPALAARARAAAEDMFAVGQGPPDAPLSAVDRANLRKWSAADLGAIAPMLAIQIAPIKRAWRRSILARPYICRLISLSLVI